MTLTWSSTAARAARRTAAPKTVALHGTVGTATPRFVVPRRVRRLAGPLVLLVSWQLGSSLGLLDSDLVPPPSEVLRAGWDLLVSGQLQRHVGRSLIRVAEGTALGVLLGVAVALLAGFSRLGEDLLDPGMQILKAVPNFALTPLLIIFMGIGEGPKVLLITLGVGIAIYVNTYGGIRNVDRQIVEMAKVVGASRVQMVRDVILPGAMPGFLVGLRLGLSSAWLSLIFAETINTTEGIGFLMSRAQTLLQFDISLLVIVIYAVAGLLSYAFVKLLERRLLSWRFGFEGV